LIDKLAVLTMQELQFKNILQ